jgi:hypothetical protein
MKSKSKKSPSAAPVVTDQLATLPEQDSLRHTFRLKFYGTPPHLSGQIENLHSQEKATFNGLDTDAMLVFLQRELGLEAPVKATPINTAAPTPLEGKLSDHIMHGQDATASILLNYSAPVSVTTQRIAACTLWLRRMEDGQTVVVSQVPTRQLSDRELEITLNAPALEQGLWQVKSQILLSGQSEEAAKGTWSNCLSGQGWLQVY